ncbi:hypothetical protein [Ammoniphilus sp. CFH 90114]|uniref:hypothetical protein n=1 Tax=Ammoniphilus sp. CFH 90114 TaxID=2493665 RepID=UPI00100E9223|nr:hypothetical protein [Ammoniphilus sp. CFH 90114]RXT04106.1 hypothetical protein EIZ39_21235 [Ammoniphilus sp. CFH 90114]
MTTGLKLQLNQEQIEKMVLDFIKTSQPEFAVQDAMLETSYIEDRIDSWWVACEHKNGDESIMEDEQILLLIQQKQGWESVVEHHIKDSEQAGFVLEVKGK